MNPSILSIQPLGFPWQTQDPFLFCVHHLDHYPAGNAEMGPNTSLAGRAIGSDFAPDQDWRMYHGSKVPGFPSHPHRGFETVTIAKQGMIDHSDSLGAAGRFGAGDVQWMTAGKGVQHCEMFPLLKQDGPNPLELFQIWLNLPRANKLVEPHFAMLWQDQIPELTLQDDAGKTTTLNLIAGTYGENQASPPPPDSWAADANHDVAIWTIRMEAGASWTIPVAKEEVNRVLYFYRGTGIQIAEQVLPDYHAAQLSPTLPLTVYNTADQECHLLLLQGKPIGEPVAQYGPFVMNDQQEIREAMRDFQQTQFGGWPWPSHEHVHPREKGRFALHADGKEEINS